MKKALMLAAVALTFAGCGTSTKDKTGYEKAAVDNFTKACKSSANGKVDCGCVIDKIKTTVSYNDYKAADTATKAGKPIAPGTKTKLEDAISGCRK
jgi:hypothetical protein